MRPPHDPQRLARAILARPEFHVRTHPQTLSPWQRFFAWFWDLFGKTLDRVPAPPASVLSAIGIAAAVAGVALVAVVFVRLILLANAAPTVPLTGARALQARISAKTWYDRALAAAQSGSYRNAVLLLFRAALAILDLRGFVHDEPSRTVNECAAELRSRAPQYLDAFAAVARSFTTALYAERPVDGPQFEAARDAYEALFSAVTHA